MSAHRALSVEDVLTEIFGWYSYALFPIAFYPGVYRDVEAERRRTLAYAARVSRSFHEAAIRVLWCNLRDLFPLLHLLPSLQKVEDHPDVAFPSRSWALYSLPKHDPEHEWDRLLKYSVHVRTLWQWKGLHTSKRLTPASWSSIRRFGERRDILSNLLSLQWIVDLSEPTAMLLFLAPSVELVTVICDSAETELDADTSARWASCLERLITEICKRNPRLTDLSFELDHVSPSSVMPHLPPLEFLQALSIQSEMGAVDLAYINSLAAMPALNELKLPSLTGTLDSRLADPSGGFHSLQLLSLRRCSPSTAFPGSASLKELGIDNYSYLNAPQLARDCAVWARAFPNLRDFVLYVDTDILEDSDTAPRPAVASVVAPLLALASLENVSLSYNTYVPFSVSDADVIALSAAWPALKSLSVIEIGFGGDFPSCSVGVLGFLAAARNCPGLTYFSLTRVVLRPEEVAALPPDSLDHGLRNLRVKYGLTEEAYGVIAEKIFPNLESKPQIDTYGLRNPASMVYADKLTTINSSADPAVEA